MPYPVFRVWRLPDHALYANESGKLAVARRRDLIDLLHHLGSITDPWALLVTLLAALILGAGHVASWNTQFLTNHGQLVWRICSIFIMGAPTLTVVGVVFMNWTQSWVYIVVVSLAYLVARFTLLLLIGYSFYSLPAGVYDTNHVEWLSFLPFFH